MISFVLRTWRVGAIAIALSLPIALWYWRYEPFAPTTADIHLGAEAHLYLSADHGIPPFSWTLSDGQLPPGLRIESNGTIHGRPLRPGDFRFVATVTNLYGSSSRRFRITVTR